MNKALFLDRDGIINVDTAYLYKKEEVVFVDGIFDLCRTASDLGYKIIVVTNQAGIARGYYTDEDVTVLHTWMREEFLKRQIALTDIYSCPYHTEGTVSRYVQDHEDRKPSPGMFLKAQKDHGIDFSCSLMIGDKPSDRIHLPDLKSLILKSRYSEKDSLGFDITTLSEVIPYLTGEKR